MLGLLVVPYFIRLLLVCCKTNVYFYQRLPYWLVIEWLVYIQIKRGADPATRSTFWRPSHCPVRRNEQRRKPHVWCKYIIHPASTTNMVKHARSQWRLYTIHPMRRFRCFVFDEQMKLRSSQNVKTKAYSYALICIYVCPILACRGLKYG